METPRPEASENRKLGLVDFYETVFGWKVIDWDDGRSVWKIRPSVDKGYRELGGSIISLNPQATPYSGNEEELNSNIGSIEVDSIENYTERIIEYGGKIDDKTVVHVPDGSRMNVGIDSTGRTFVLVEHLGSSLIEG